MTYDITKGVGPTQWPDLPDPAMLDRILRIIADEGKVDVAKIKPDATLDSLGMMSIDVVSILMGIEEEFDAYIPMSANLQAAENLHDLIKTIVTEMTPDHLKTITSPS